MLRLIFLLLILAGYCAPVYAQIYKYIDKDGVVRYTDDITKVPEDQQATAEQYAEPESSPTSPTPPVAPQMPPVPPPKAAQPQKDLSEQKQMLEKEYKDLMAEKEWIEKETAIYSKRYKTRSRKGVSRKKLNELEAQKAEWDKKFLDYQAKKKALEMLDGEAAAKK